ncbi:MAG: alpha-isopropylmalate synthase regulatory domain-containing protein [Tissierellales bacterium]
MNKKIIIKDYTLANCEKDKSLNLTFKERLEIAKQLDEIKPDVIETPFADSNQSALIEVKSLASVINNAIISCPANLNKDSIDKAYEALKGKNKTRVHLFAPVSIINMEYTLGMKQDKVLDLVKNMISYAKDLFTQVEFTALDASRAQRDFLIQILKAAQDSGANILGVEDSQGHMLANEIQEFIGFLHNNLDLNKGNILSFRAKDDLGMAVSNSLMAIKENIDQIATSIKGLSLDARLEDTINAINAKAEQVKAVSLVDISKLNRVSVLLDKANAAKSELYLEPSLTYTNGQDSVVDKSMDYYTFRSFVEDLGYELLERDLERVFFSFQVVAKKKQQVFIKDIEAIIGKEAIQTPKVYQLKDFVINSGNTINATASLSLIHKEKVLTAVEMGDGPIDAAFHAIEKIIGLNAELFNFGLQSVTEGKDALGAATVQVRYEGKIYTGKGLSTDVIESSILAYLNAVNKVLNEER